MLAFTAVSLREGWTDSSLVACKIHFNLHTTEAAQAPVLKSFTLLVKDKAIYKGVRANKYPLLYSRGHQDTEYYPNN